MSSAEHNRRSDQGASSPDTFGLEVMYESVAQLRDEVERLRSECAVCEKCGHVQAEPNWCHECRHRTTAPDWAKPLLDAWTDRQNLREAIFDALADLTPGIAPHGFLRDALDASEALGVSSECSGGQS